MTAEWIGQDRCHVYDDGYVFGAVIVDRYRSFFITPWGHFRRLASALADIAKRLRAAAKRGNRLTPPPIDPFWWWLLCAEHGCPPEHCGCRKRRLAELESEYRRRFGFGWS